MVYITLTKLAFVASLVPALLTGASPAPQQPVPATNPCSPSFQGVASYIQAYNTYNRWYVPNGSQQTSVISTMSAGQTKWRIEGTGSAANDYVIKLVDSSNRYDVQPWRGNTISLGLVQGQGNPTFEIKCNSCYPPGTLPSAGTFIGNTCYIIEHATGNYITEVSPSGGKGSLSRQARNGSSNQFFHIVAA